MGVGNNKMSLLPDGSIAVISVNWAWLRIYKNGILVENSHVQWPTCLENQPKKHQKYAWDDYTIQHQNTPDIISEMIAKGNDVRRMYPSIMFIEMTVHNNDIWIHLPGRLFTVDPHTGAIGPKIYIVNNISETGEPITDSSDIIFRKGEFLSTSIIGASIILGKIYYDD